MLTDTDRESWKLWRRQGIGATDAVAIIGLSRYASPFSVWADKTGAIPDDDTDSDYAEFGRRAEVMVTPWFTSVTGYDVMGEQTWCSSPDVPHQRATVDGFVFESSRHSAEPPPLDAAIGLLEVKTRGPGRRYEELPPEMAAQGQWQMLVTGLPMVWFAVLHGRRLEIYELAADVEDQAWMAARVGAFWRDHVLTGEPPPLDGHEATLAALAALYPEATAKLEHDLDGSLDALRLLREAKRWGKAAAELEKSAKAVLVWAMGPAAIGTVDGRKALTLGNGQHKATCKACGHVEEGAKFRALNVYGEWKP